MKKLHIGKNFSLPLDFVTQTQAILAKKRVGKSYTASVQAEELLKAEQQVVIIDPTGAWWGLKSSADGKSEGFPIAIFGGEHADVPLEEGAGEIVATAIVEQRFSAILDLTLFRKGQINRFMAPFLETLYRLNRDAMHLFVDEADAIAPQKPFGEEARMLGAMEDVVRRGGIRGIGCTMITQRPAVLNKNVLTQAEMLTVLRIVHHKDIGAIEEWVAVHGDEKLMKQLKESLPSLPIGTAWVWSPGWGDIFERVEIRQRETFDSGATPKAGQVIKKPKVQAAVDLQKLGEKIAATVERQKENDPRALKAKIADLQKQLLKTVPAAKSTSAPNPAAIERAEKQGRAAAEKELRPLLVERDRTIARLHKQIASIAAIVGKPLELPKPVPVAQVERPQLTNNYLRPTVERVASVRKEPNGDSAGLSGPESRILNAIAWMNSIGVDSPQITAVAFLAGYTIGGGAFNNPKGALRSKGLVEYLPGERIRLTTEGEALAQVPSAPLDASELQRMVLERLPGPEQKILRALLENPEGLSNEELANAAGYAQGGGAFNNPKGRLRSLGLIDYRSGLVVPERLLFLEGN